MKLLTREPVLTIAAVQAILTALAAFGLELSADQTAALIGASGALLAVLVRQAVVSPATIASSSTSPKKITGLAGVLVKAAREERGDVPVALLIGLAILGLVLAAAFVTCDAMIDAEDDDLGHKVVASALAAGENPPGNLLDVGALYVTDSYRPRTPTAAR